MPDRNDRRSRARSDAAEVVRRLRARVGAALARLPADARVGVAFSGGADSSTLADCVIATLGAGRVVLVHVDHGLRGPVAAGAERRVVERFARAAGVELVARAVEVDGTGEAAARRARYAVFAQVAGERGLARVLTGHTARDQAETVLMRVVRGTGPAGLAGIAPRRGRYLRPLLATTRAEIDAYVAARGLTVAHDETNDEPRFLRNRVRATLLPALAAENPQLEAALCRLADASRAWRRALVAEAKRRWREAERAGGRLHAPTLAAAPDAVLAIVLGRAARLARIEISAAHLRAMRPLVRAATAGTTSIDLPGGRFIREYDDVYVQPNARAPACDPLELRVDFAEPFDVRLVQPGDRMRPVRLAGRSRKLSNLFTDARVPRRLRAVARVVIRRGDQVILWAEHLGPAHDVAITVSDPAKREIRSGPT